MRRADGKSPKKFKSLTPPDRPFMPVNRGPCRPSHPQHPDGSDQIGTMSVRVKVITIRSEERPREDGEESLRAVVESALRILNYSQTQFQFDFDRARNQLSPISGKREFSPSELKKLLEHAPEIVAANNAAFHAWTDVEELLTKEKARFGGGLHHRSAG